jgi:hypothetical protein
MKQVSIVLAIILLSNLAGANAEDQHRTNGIQDPQGRVFSYSRRRWRFARYYSAPLNATAIRPVVPSPVTGGENAFFHGTGDGSAGDWTRR